MTQAERNKLYVARCLLDGKMTIKEASEILALSERQVKRIKKGVKEQGEAFVIHKNRGHKPSHALTDKVQNLVVNHKNSEKYRIANFSHFQELLQEHEAINLSKSSVYRILVWNGFTSPKKHIKVKHHKRRKRNLKEVCWYRLMPVPIPGFLTVPNAHLMEQLMMPPGRS